MEPGILTSDVISRKLSAFRSLLLAADRKCVRFLSGFPTPCSCLSIAVERRRIPISDLPACRQAVERSQTLAC